MFHKIHTSCKNCLFGVYNGITQVSCRFKRIEHHTKNAIEAYDEDREFYVLNETVCRYKRTSGWIHAKEDFDTQTTEVGKENELKYRVFINNSGPCGITECVESLCAQTIKPQQIDLICPEMNKVHSNPESHPRMWNPIFQQMIQPHGITGQMRQSTSLIESFYAAVDLGLNNNKVPFFVTMDRAEVLPPNLFEQINDKILNNGLKFFILTKNGLPFITLSYIQKQFKLTDDFALIETLKENKCQDSILKLEDHILL